MTQVRKLIRNMRHMREREEAVQRLIISAKAIFDIPKYDRALDGSLVFADALDELHDALAALEGTT